MSLSGDDEFVIIKGGSVIGPRGGDEGVDAEEIEEIEEAIAAEEPNGED